MADHPTLTNSQAQLRETGEDGALAVVVPCEDCVSGLACETCDGNGYRELSGTKALAALAELLYDTTTQPAAAPLADLLTSISDDLSPVKRGLTVASASQVSPDLAPYLTETTPTRIVQRCPDHDSGCRCDACRHDGGVIELDGDAAVNGLLEMWADDRLGDVHALDLLSILRWQVAPGTSEMRRANDRLRAEVTRLRQEALALRLELHTLRRREQVGEVIQGGHFVRPGGAA